MINRLIRAWNAFNGRVVPTELEARALSFAAACLEHMERTGTWDNRLCQMFSVEAMERKLGIVNDFRRFERTTDGMWLSVITPKPDRHPL